MFDVLLVGGPMDGKRLTTREKYAAIETPLGPYVRVALSPAVSVYVFTESKRPANADRWAPKRKGNPFPIAPA